MTARHRKAMKILLALWALALFLCGAASAAPEASSSRPRGKVIPTKIYGGGQFPVYYRTPLPVTAPAARYPGFHPEKSILRAGTVRVSGAAPLICDILLERDVQIRLRDGTVIYADVFRPADEGQGRVPALLCISPYGKEIGGQHLDDLPGRMGVSKDLTSGLERFEGLDPAYWVAQGYAVVNPDPRGAYSSRGNINYWGCQYAEDGYDIVEWIAIQPWCNGRVGMAGNSWLAVSQWFIAAENPPHLEAIAPWEGFSDHFRETSCRGGIPAPEFPELIASLMASKSGLLEDQPQMIVRYPFMNAYWADKAARLELITVPAYVVASYTNGVHTFGTFEGFRRISSREKWLRVHTTQEWYDFYDPENVADLTKFFDYYLKDANNGWEMTPRVRLSVYDLGHSDVKNRAEDDFPLERTQETCLYLDMASRSLSWNKPQSANVAAYDSENESASVSFTYRFDKDIELTGFMSLHLWAAAAECDDMDIAVRVEKLGRDGRLLNSNDFGPVAATGRIRASCRALDESRSTLIRPILSGAGERKLTPGRPVSLEISIWPMGMIYHAGESLRLTIMPYLPEEADIPFGTAPIVIPRDTFTTDPGETGRMMTLGGGAPPVREKSNAYTPRNQGAHLFYGGGEYDSYILVPVVPAK